MELSFTIDELVKHIYCNYGSTGGASVDLKSQLAHIVAELATDGERFWPASYYQGRALGALSHTAYAFELRLRGYIGDVVLTAPALDALLAFTHYQEAPSVIHVVTRFPFLLSGTARNASNVFIERQDVTDPDYNSVGLELTAFNQSSVVLFKEELRYTRGSLRDRVAVHLSLPLAAFRSIEYVLGRKLLKDLGAYRCSLRLDRKTLRTARIASGIPAHQTYAVVAFAASDPRKRMSPPYFARLIRELFRIQEFPSQLVVPIPDEKYSQSFVDVLRALPVRIACQVAMLAMPLERLCALVSGAQIVITPDTGLGHVAAASGARTLMLFATANPYVWSLPNQRLHFLYTDDVDELIRENRIQRDAPPDGPDYLLDRIRLRSISRCVRDMLSTM